MSGDEIDILIKEVKRKALLRGTLFLVLSVVFLGGFLAVAFLLFDVQRLEITATVGILAGGVVSAYLAAFCIALLVVRMPRNFSTEAVLRRRTDEIQRDLSRAHVIWTCVSLFSAPGFGTMAGRILDGSWPAWAAVPLVFAVAFLAFSMLAPFFRSYFHRKASHVFDDELFAAYRAAGMKAGFLVLLGALVAVFALGLWRPGWVVFALPVVIVVGATVPGLWVAILYRRADRDD